MSETTMTVMRARQTGVSVSAAQLARWIEYGPAPLVIDVRDPWQWVRGHVPDAENIPVSCAPELVRRIPDDGLVVLVCEDGLLSREVARMLEFCGFRQVVHLAGGMRAWDARRGMALVA